MRKLSDDERRDERRALFSAAAEGELAVGDAVRRMRRITGLTQAEFARRIAGKGHRAHENGTRSLDQAVGDVDDPVLGDAALRVESCLRPAIDAQRGETSTTNKASLGWRRRSRDGARPRVPARARSLRPTRLDSFARDIDLLTHSIAIALEEGFAAGEPDTTE
ncbi:MAG: hypothetical protein M3Y87_09095 [Myxococcota bacterium]|nr:hypothetical protein [Myxococcota bacterium]